MVFCRWYSLLISWIAINLDDLSKPGLLDVQIAEQTECENLIESYLDKKRVLYEQVLLQKISMEKYKAQTAIVDRELDRLREIQGALKAQTVQMQSDEKTKSTRAKLAREVVGTDGLTAGLVDTLIDRVYVYPGHQLDIVWKMKDFCVDQ